MGVGEERLVGHYNKANIERGLVYYQIYTIYYTGLHLENCWKIMEGGGKGDRWVTIKRANIKREYQYTARYIPYTI